MPNGAYPAGMFGSVKAPGVFAGLKLSSNTSTVPAWKLLAKILVPSLLPPIASP